MVEEVYTIEEIIQKINQIDFTKYLIDYETLKTIIDYLYYTAIIPKDKFYSLLSNIEEAPLTEKEKITLKHLIAATLMYINNYP